MSHIYKCLPYCYAPFTKCCFHVFTTILSIFTYKRVLHSPLPIFQSLLYPGAFYDPMPSISWCPPYTSALRTLVLSMHLYHQLPSAFLIIMLSMQFSSSFHSTMLFIPECSPYTNYSMPQCHSPVPTIFLFQDMCSKTHQSVLNNQHSNN